METPQEFNLDDFLTHKELHPESTVETHGELSGSDWDIDYEEDGEHGGEEITCDICGLTDNSLDSTISDDNAYIVCSRDSCLEWLGEYHSESGADIKLPEH